MPYDVLIAALIGIITLISVILILRKFNKSTIDQVSETNETIDTKKKSETKTTKKKEFVLKDKKIDSKQQFTHKWIYTTLKGHTDNIVDFDISCNNRHLTSVGSERSICFWKTNDIHQKDKKVVRSTVELDNATKVKFSPDDKACIFSLLQSNTIRIMRIKKDNGKYTFTTGFDFPNHSAGQIIDIGIATTGNYIMTCHNDTHILLWNISGKIMHQIDTGNIKNYCGAISPCGRYVVGGGFASDSKVWAVEFEKPNLLKHESNPSKHEQTSLKHVVKAFSLSHNSSILGFAFNSNSTRLVSISKDGNWKLWDISVDYRNQDARVLKSGDIKLTDHMKQLNRISASLSFHTLVIGCNTTIWFIDLELSKIITEINSLPSPITQILYEQHNQMFFVSFGRQIVVFRDVVALQVDLRNLKEKLKQYQVLKKDNHPDIKQIEKEIFMKEKELGQFAITS